MELDSTLAYSQPAQREVRIATTFAELEGWGSAFDRFLERIGEYGLFYHAGWLRSIWPAYSLVPNSLFFISVWQGGELLAVAPFQLMQKGVLQGRRRVIYFFGTHHPTLVNPWPDILVAREEMRGDCIRSILEKLSHCRSRWDQIELHHWPEESANLPLLEREWPEAEFSHDAGRSALVNLGQGFDQYLASLSRNLRNQVRRYRRRLEAGAGDVRFLCTDHLPPARWAAINDMHYQRQQRLNRLGRDRYSIFGNAREADALRRALEWAEQQGRARHYWLDIDNQPAAFSLGLHMDRTSFFSFVGMDERAEPYSGGMLLLFHLIEEEARRHGTQSIDLLFGINRNKRRFANRERRLCQCVRGNRESMLAAARNGWVRLAKSIKGLPGRGGTPSGP